MRHDNADFVLLQKIFARKLPKRMDETTKRKSFCANDNGFETKYKKWPYLQRHCRNVFHPPCNFQPEQTFRTLDKLFIPITIFSWTAIQFNYSDTFNIIIDFLPLFEKHPFQKFDFHWIKLGEVDNFTKVNGILGMSQ